MTREKNDEEKTSFSEMLGEVIGFLIGYIIALLAMIGLIALAYKVVWPILRWILDRLGDTLTTLLALKR